MALKNVTKKLIVSILFGIFLYTPIFSYADTVQYSISNKCVIRKVTFSVNSIGTDKGFSTEALYFNAYFLEGSTYSYSALPVPAQYVISSGNVPMYFDIQGRTLAPGAYNGSSAVFAGSASTVVLGNPVLISNTVYDNTGVTCRNGLPQSDALYVPPFVVTTQTQGLTNISANVTGAGSYVKGSNITVTFPGISGYVFNGFAGTCNNQSFQQPVNYSATSYSYTISNISSNCNIIGQYGKYSEIVYSYNVETSTDEGGSVSIKYGAGTTTSSTVVSKNVMNGDTIQIYATPSPGYTFGGWSGDFSGSPQGFSLSVRRNYKAKAIFLGSGFNTGTTTDSSSKCVNFYSNPSQGGYVAASGGGAIGGCFNVFNNTVTLFGGAVPYDGYRFLGFSSTNTPASLIARFNGTDPARHNFQPGDLYTTTSTHIAIFANFEFTGELQEEINPNNSFTEPIVQSPEGVAFDRLLTTYEEESGLPLPRSPYTIDSRCVNKVVTFTGYFSKFGAPSPVKRTYTVYSLQGSRLSLEKNFGYLYTFNSDPSELYYTNTTRGLSPGSYTSDSPLIAGHDNNVSFIRIVPISKQSFSCGNTDETFKLAPYWVGGYAIAQALSFLSDSYVPPLMPPVEDKLIFEFFSASNAGYAFKKLGYNNIRDRGIKLPASAVNCQYFSNIIDSSDWPYQLPTPDYVQDIGCPIQLKVFDTPPYSVSKYQQYRYAWVLSSQPVRHFYHENKVGDSNYYDLQLNPVDKVHLLETSLPSTVVSTSSLPNKYYLSRINFDLCSQTSPSNYYNFYDGNGDDFEPCTARINAPIFNGLIFDTGSFDGATSSPGYTASSTFTSTGPTLQIYGLLFTDSTLDISTFSNLASFKTYILNVVSNKSDVEGKGLQTVETEEVRQYFQATTTSPGYYQEVPGYYETLYQATTTATSTGGTITKVGDDWLHTFTSNGTFSSSNNFNLQYLIVAGGGSGSVVEFAPGGAGGGAGEVLASSSYSFSSSSVSIVVGVGGQSRSTPGSGYDGATSTAFGLSARPGKGPTASNGGNSGSGYTGGSASSYAGGGAGHSGNGHNGISSSDGLGGPGYVSSITGSSVEYSKGGGGFYTFSSVGTPGSGGFGGNGSSDVGQNGVVYIRYNPTIPGYYYQVYHATTTEYVATTTNPAYYYSGTSTIDKIVSLEETKQSDFSLYTSDSYNPNLAFLGSGYDVDEAPMLYDLSSALVSKYDYNACVDSSQWGAFAYVYCGLISFGVWTVTKLIIPDSSFIRSMHVSMINSFSSTSSAPFFTTALTIPFKFKDYSNILWTPATTTRLSLGLNSTQKVYFNPSNLPAEGSVRYTVDKAIYNYIIPFLYILLYSFVFIGFIRLFRIRT